MAPQFSRMMYKFYINENKIQILICIPYNSKFKNHDFSNSIAEKLKKYFNFKLVKIENGPFPPLDGKIFLYSTEDSNIINDYINEKYPGFIARIVKLKKYLSYLSKEDLFNRTIKIELETSHDFSCIIIQYKNGLINKDTIADIIKETADQYQTKIHENIELPDLDMVITSNKKF